METLLHLGALIVGLVLLIKGADFLVHGAAAIAKRLGVSTFVLGLTVVAFGTSAPELAASVGAVLKGAPGLAVGNAVGSNIANICLVLGVTAAIRSLPASSPGMLRDVLIMVGVTLMAMATMLDGEISRFEGVVLVIGIVLYTAFNYVMGKGDAPEHQAELAEELEHELHIDTPEQAGPVGKNVILVVIGLVMLAGGSELLVRGASYLAELVGVPEHVIGLTVVAFGTSVPELATSAVAAMRRESDIAIGNIVGSNVFNLLSVLGIASLVRPIAVPPQTTRQDVWVMLATSAVLAPIVMTGRIGRPAGVFLAVVYVSYTAVLFGQELGVSPV